MTPPRSGVTVRAALALAPIARAVPEVVSGADRVGRDIRWAHVVEGLRGVREANAGDLLFVAARSLGAAARDQRRFADALADRDVAGVAVDVSAERLPAAFLDAAARARLPVVALHRHVSSLEMAEAIHGAVLRRQVETGERLRDLQRRLTARMLAGDDAADVIELLAAELGKPVVLERAGVGLLYQAGGDHDADVVIAAFQALRRGIDTAPDCSAAPVGVRGDERWGRLLVLAVDGDLTELDVSAAELTAPLVALAVSRGDEEQRIAARERGGFLHDLATRALTEAECATRASELGFGVDAHGLLPIAISADAFGDDAARRATSLMRTLERELRSRRIGCVTGVDADTGLAVVALRELDDRARVAELVATILRGAGDPTHEPVVSVGRAAERWRDVRAGLHEALRSLAAARALRRGSWHDAARVHLDDLLWGLREHADVQVFADSQLGQLVDYDLRRQQSLVHTLEVYCRHGGRKAETARALFLERQTLYYRLRRIQEILDVDLDDEDTRLSLHLALRMRRHLPAQVPALAGDAPDHEGAAARRSVVAA